MAKDKKKKNTAEHKERQALKSDRKAQKTERKLAKGCNEDDLDEILLEFQRKQAERVVITVEESDPPTPRSNATLSVNPLDPSELILFGGEQHNGQVTSYFSDMFIFSVDTNAWRKVKSPNSPGPRSSHQMAALPSGNLFLFGGEFSNKSETRFLAYRDFWKFNVKDRSWENLDIKPIPPPRCGHRVAVWKNFIVMHGGFYDTGAFTKYLDDTWLFCSRTFKWHRLETPTSNRPSPRSGFQLFPSMRGVYLYGGYSSTTKSANTTGVTHSDLWHLTLSSDLDPNQMVWEKVKKSGTYPSPRAGMAVVPFKERAIFFGGVEDKETEEDIISAVFNDMYVFNMDQEKFYPSTTRKAAEGDVKDNRPVPRFSPCLAIAKSSIYLYGGLSVIDTKQYTLGDLWHTRADKLDEWKCLYSCGVLDWVESDEDDSGSDTESSCDDLHHVSRQSSPGTPCPDECDQVDNHINPRRNELLKDFYARTSTHWLAISLENNQQSAKELKRLAFAQAQLHYETVIGQMKFLAIADD